MPAKLRAVARKKINAEGMPARFPRGTLARVKALLVDRETHADFLRKAVETEIRRREELREAVEREIQRRSAAEKR